MSQTQRNANISLVWLLLRLRKYIMDYMMHHYGEKNVYRLSREAVRLDRRTITELLDVFSDEEAARLTQLQGEEAARVYAVYSISYKLNWGTMAGICYGLRLPSSLCDDLDRLFSRAYPERATTEHQRIKVPPTIKPLSLLVV